MVGITGNAIGFVQNIGQSLSHMPTAEAVIFDIALILIISAVLGFIARLLRQPLIPAYVLAGLLIGPLALGYIQNHELINAFSEIGIAFLLFIAGLEISFKKIKEANLKKIAFIGIIQITIIFLLAIGLSSFLGLSVEQAAYIGIILAFGSTMVDIKLLAERGELVTLHGRLVLGILLFQDLVAIIAIVIFTAGGFVLAPLLMAMINLMAMILTAFLLQKYVLNKVFKFAAKSSELLFLSSLAILFLFIILAYVSHISIVIGAFIAGVALANSPYKTELESRITPLRDFFAILFFVSLGMQLVFNGVGQMTSLLWFLIIGGLLIKPFLTFFLLRVTRYHQKTSFHTSISLAQLSEFSLIIGMLGLTLGVIDGPMLSTIILATIITMSLTPYFITYKDRIFKFLQKPLALFSFLPVAKSLSYEGEGKKEILLIGAHRMGSVLLEEMMEKKDKLIVIDYNPEVVAALANNGISCIYGDISSPEILHYVNTKKLKTVISTVPEYDDNLFILRKVKELRKNIRVVVTGSRISETKKLYKAGADYVITPKIVAGSELGKIINSDGKNIKKARKKHEKHLDNLHRLLY